MKTTRTLIVTQKDLDRLKALLENYRGDADTRPYIQALKQELEQAQIVESKDIPPNVVTMNTTVKVRSDGAKRGQTMTIVYPERADIDEDRISVLAPLGTALLGYREGDVVEWEVPAGRRKFTIEKIVYQPEASGDVD